MPYVVSDSVGLQCSFFIESVSFLCLSSPLSLSRDLLSKYIYFAAEDVWVSSPASMAFHDLLPQVMLP